MTFKDGAYYPIGTAGSSDMSEGEYQEVYDYPDYDEYTVTSAIGYWRKRDGNVIEIVSMTDAHLDNAIKYFRGVDHPKIDELHAERARRGR